MTDRSFQKPVPPGIHVILGDSAAGIFRRVFHPGDRLVIDRDVLSCGPTLHCDDVQAWRSMRRAFWDTVPEHRAEATGFGLLDEGERFRKAEWITIWAATGLNEQLFIAHVLHRIEEWGVDFGNVCLVRFETLRDRPSTRVVGTGELNEQHMSEHPEPVRISDATRQDYRAAWAALTSPDPTLIERFGEKHPGANDWLKQAMQLLLRRFPNKQSGMAWWDFALLSEVRSRGPRAARVIGYTIGNAIHEPDLVGDLYLFGRLLRLGDPRLPAPLLEVAGDRMDMREVEVTLTSFGRDVLDGTASNYPTNPIEDWASGVRLSSDDGALWFNDKGTLIREGG